MVIVEEEEEVMVVVMVNAALEFIFGLRRLSRVEVLVLNATMI